MQHHRLLVIQSDLMLLFLLFVDTRDSTVSDMARDVSTEQHSSRWCCIVHFYFILHVCKTAVHGHRPRTRGPLGLLVIGRNNLYYSIFLGGGCILEVFHPIGASRCTDIPGAVVSKIFCSSQ